MADEPVLQERRYGQEFPGWQRVRQPACPRVVAGLECEGPSCFCARSGFIMDHRRLWRDRHGNLIMTTEPYPESYSAEEMERFFAGCWELGLDLKIADTSPYAPGEADLFIVR